MVAEGGSSVPLTYISNHFKATRIWRDCSSKEYRCSLKITSWNYNCFKVLSKNSYYADALIYQLLDFTNPHFSCQSYVKNGVNPPVCGLLNCFFYMMSGMASTAARPSWIGILMNFQLGWDSDSLFGGICAVFPAKVVQLLCISSGSNISLKPDFRNPVCNLEGGGVILNLIKIISRTFVEGKSWRKGRSQRAINENIRLLAECHFACKANTEKRKKWFLGFWFL